MKLHANCVVILAPTAT